MKTSVVLHLCGVLFSVNAAGAAKPDGKKTADADRKEVVELMGRMDRAMTARNIADYMALIDSSAEFHLNTPTSQGPQAMNFNYEEYRQMVASSFADASSYQVRRQDLQVTALPEGKMMATDLLFESIKMKDREFKTITSERMLFARKGGAFKLIGLGSNVVSSTK